MTVRLDLAAKQEIHKAALFYEDCREGLGQEFVDSVESAFEQIQQHPTVWRILKGDSDAISFRGFPMASSMLSKGKGSI